MRTMMYFAFLFTVLVANAEGKVTLEVVTKNHYSSTWSKLSQTSTGWICKTELGLDRNLRRKPASIALAPKGKPLNEPCRDQLTVKIPGNKPWQGCASEPAAKKFLAALARDCGR
jgi:hypothetical protein